MNSQILNSYNKIPLLSFGTQTKFSLNCDQARYLPLHYARRTLIKKKYTVRYNILPLCTYQFSSTLCSMENALCRRIFYRNAVLCVGDYYLPLLSWKALSDWFKDALFPTSLFSLPRSGRREKGRQTDRQAFTSINNKHWLTMVWCPYQVAILHNNKY